MFIIWLNLLSYIITQSQTPDSTVPAKKPRSKPKVNLDIDIEQMARVGEVNSTFTLLTISTATV